MGMLISLNTAFPLDKGNADAENEMMVRFVKGSGESVIRRNSSNDVISIRYFKNGKLDRDHFRKDFWDCY